MGECKCKRHTIGEIMATVRMSDELVTRLTNQYNSDYDKTNPNKEIPSSLGDILYKTAIQPGLDKFKAMVDTTPGFTEKSSKDYFIGMENELNVAIMADSYVTDEDGQPFRESRSYEISVPLSAEREQFSRGYSGSLTLDFKDTFDIHDEELAQAVADISAIVSFNSKNKYNKSLKQDKFVSALRQFTTLNQALKAWPALSKVVQEAWPEKMVTVHKRTERKAQEKKNKEMMDGVAQELNTVILGGSLLED